MNLSNECKIGLPALVEGGLLAQANTGGGKSHLIRKILEETAGHVQQLIIDPEGEYITLREKFDLVICAPKGADAIANPDTAATLARRLLELRVSAVLNISELKPPERQAFVRLFLEALVNARPELWHPVLVVLDEAHIFCPEKGKSESAGAVIDLAARGRKRGFRLIMATQRLSKLHKDAAAEMINKAIGRTGLDIDVKRAADELGLPPREATERLRNLQPGEFYVYGPAFSQTVLKTKIGPVLTSQPKHGGRTLTAPPAPSEKIRAILAKGLQDIQKEAVEELRTSAELKAELTKVRAALTLSEKRAAAAGVPEAEVQRRIKVAVSQATPAPVQVETLSPKLRPLLEKALDLLLPVLKSRVQITTKPVIPVPTAVRRPAGAGPVRDGITGPEQKILDTLAKLEAFGLESSDKAMVAAHAGVSPTSGGYFNNLGKLRSAGLVVYPTGGKVALTEAGRENAIPPFDAPTLTDLHDSWIRILPRPQADILSALIAVYPEAMTKVSLADQVSVSRTSGGFFNNLGRLRTLGAIDYPQPGAARAADILFPKVGK